ncbi:hypothetical protein [uncultured Ilyobacter sp.]|nr:hypothetical protein [uncultured Ilyobacter sp.]
MIARVGGFLQDFEKAEKMTFGELEKTYKRIIKFYEFKYGKA